MNDWAKYPIGTKVYSVWGGYWIKTERGYKWCTGADWCAIELPKHSSIAR